MSNRVPQPADELMTEVVCVLTGATREQLLEVLGKLTCEVVKDIEAGRRDLSDTVRVDVLARLLIERVEREVKGGD